MTVMVSSLKSMTLKKKSIPSERNCSEFEILNDKLGFELLENLLKQYEQLSYDLLKIQINSISSILS